MSATAFQRMRRESAAKKLMHEIVEKEPEKQEEVQLPPDNTEEANPDEIEEVEIDTEEVEEPKKLSDMTIEELKAYADENGIDIGKSTSHNGILEKIKAAEKM